MSGQEIRTKYMRRFAGLEKNSRRDAWVIFTSYIAQITASVAIGHVLLQQATLPAILLAALCALFIATRLRGLNNIVHECCHFTFCEDRQTNILLGSLSASLVLSSFRDYQEEHLSHHKHLGDYDHDLDLQGVKNLRLHDPLTFGTVTRHIITPLIGRHLPYYLGINLSARDGIAFQAFKIGLVASVVALAFWNPLTILFLVVFPFAWIYSALNFWTDCLDHAGLLASNDELDASRNIIAPKIIRMIFFPRHDCFHLVHHLFPHVPAGHLEFCHTQLEAEGEYRERTHASNWGFGERVVTTQMVKHLNKAAP